MISIIAIGKRHDALLQKAIEDYQKRLKTPFDVQWLLLLPHSSLEGEQARKEESKRLLEKVNPDDYLILLDEKGQLFNNSQLEKALSTPLQSSKKVFCIIGGAYGVDETVRRRANIVWSLSPLVLPHQLVRLVLIEQLYRSYTIASGHPYHHS